MIMVRPAKLEEVSWLQGNLAQRVNEGYEQFDLRQAIVFVAEDTEDGLRAGMVCARLRTNPISAAPMWMVEPLMLFRTFVRLSPAHSQRKATYLLAKAIEAYITDRSRNTTGVHTFFLHIETKNKAMHGLARHIGWSPAKYKIYTGGY